jgi:cytochrome c oxidase cbb3-type subunit III
MRCRCRHLRAARLGVAAAGRATARSRIDGVVKRFGLQPTGYGLQAVTLAGLALLLTVVPAGAQHETAFDVEDGSRAFRTSCQGCHGPDGDEIAGVDLGRGQFKRASTDADLVRIIRNGIPGTPMPPVNMSEAQATRIVAYLRSVAASKRSVSAAGDATRGRSLFEGKGQCATCHRVNGLGGRLGPELSGIGQVRRAVELEQSVLDPNAEVLPTNRFYRVVTRDGATVTGRLLNHDTFTVQLLDAKEQLRSFAKADLREQGFMPSPMPSSKSTLTPGEVTDVVSYLVSLKGKATR